MESMHKIWYVGWGDSWCLVAKTWSDWLQLCLSSDHECTTILHRLLWPEKGVVWLTCGDMGNRSPPSSSVVFPSSSWLLRSSSMSFWLALAAWSCASFAISLRARYIDSMSSSSSKRSSSSYILLSGWAARMMCCEVAMGGFQELRPGKLRHLGTPMHLSQLPGIAGSRKGIPS